MSCSGPGAGGGPQFAGAAWESTVEVGSSSRSKVSVGPDPPFESRNCRLLRIQSLCGEEHTGGQWGGAVGNEFQ